MKKKGQIRTPRELVLEYYPNAKAVNVGCKKGDYYNIMDGDKYMGQGKSAENAWMAAYKNYIQN